MKKRLLFPLLLSIALFSALFVFSVSAEEAEETHVHAVVFKTKKATFKNDGEVKGVCSLCKETTELKIIPKIKKAVLSKTSYTYNGKNKTPKVSVFDSSEAALKKGRDFTVGAPAKRKNVGVYYVTVTFKGNYSGEKKLRFKVLPKGTVISSLTAEKEGFEATWKKQKKQTDGYILELSTSKSFKNPTRKTVKNPSQTSKSFSSLKGSKTYYLRIKTFKTVTVNSKKVRLCSEVSGPKKVKTLSKTQKIFFGAPGGNTLTGLKPLKTVSYKVPDPNNTRSLSQAKRAHSHGPASGGKPHDCVVSFQKTFNRFGALTLDTLSREKVLYLTFDCGWEHDNLTSKVLNVLKKKKVSAAFFCTLDHIKNEPELIRRMINEGHIVGNHSTTHPSFAEIGRTRMTREIEQVENYLRKNFGYCAKFFRFPKGEYSESALDLVSSLGYTSVFWSVAYADWDVSVVRGKDYTVKTVTERLHPGAVILLHCVSRDNAAALGEIIDKARAQGYVFKSLDEYPGNK